MVLNILKFMKKFNKEYAFLYDCGDRMAGYQEVVEAGDAFIKRHPDFIGEFVRYRGDLLSSDREVAAFMLALDDMQSELEAQPEIKVWAKV